MLLRLAAALALLALPARADVWSFATPSGNIECVVGEGFSGSDIECTIYARSAPAAIPGLEGCPVSRGVTVSMLNRGVVRAACAPAGARATGAQSVAAYNQEGSFGGFVCYSATSGLQCRNEDAHGFHLSRASQSAF